MKYVIPMIVVAFLIQFGTVLASTQGISRATAETGEEEVQFTQHPLDGNYKHGVWCMDSRAF